RAIRTASRLNSSLCPFAIVQGNIALKGPELNRDKSTTNWPAFPPPQWQGFTLPLTCGENSLLIF
ncbi:hypothetical protein, partial [Aliiroseovarius crassostreae]|uniref:hypothetical protein n=1 Tax=Aliiroseovarius crassostreae TaxID=154981 RepID=UPI001C31B080